MRLVTFEAHGKENWGFVIKHPETGADWVFQPAQTVECMLRHKKLASSGWLYSLPPFAQQEWPDTLQGFLELGPEAMNLLRELQSYTLLFLRDVDPYLLEAKAGYELSAVHLRAPIPRPRLMFGLVGNTPSFWRNSPNREHVIVYPQGHQRCIGSIVGHGETVLKGMNFNVEMGVIIGKGGRDIPVEKAMEHVAGYTVVVDSQNDDYYPLFLPGWQRGKNNIEAELDWYVAATCSWCGKKVDNRCLVGPFLTTPDEVGNPYDLLVYTLQNDKQRERSHTAGSFIGIENTIHWLSTFMELHPGDLIHMGTMGTDSLPVPKDDVFTREDTVGSEIEKVGRVTGHVLDVDKLDWRTEEEKHPNADYAPRDESIRDSMVPAVRDYLRMGRESITSFDPAQCCHVWTCYGNYQDVQKHEPMAPVPIPRFLNGPASALGYKAPTIRLASRAKDLVAGVEMAFVISRLASRVKAEDADDYILGYAPVISLSDRSFFDRVREPASLQERLLPNIYGRWGDGYQVMGEISSRKPEWNEKLTLSIPGIGQIESSLGEYIDRPGKIIETISQMITLFPGDVVLMGRLADRIEITREQADGLQLIATAEGYETLTTQLERL